MIAIIAAMDQEVEALASLMQQVEYKEISGIPMTFGMLEETAVLLMKSGVGKGNAAISTTILLERFPVTYVLNIGTAGGLKSNENVLDVVVGTKVVQHDYDTSVLDGVQGKGLYFQADDKLANICFTTLSEMGICVHRGLIASGDQFISSSKQLTYLEEAYPEAICAEMEAGAVAQVCAHYQKPFVVLRSLSDIAHKENSHMDFTEYVVLASKRSAEACRKIIYKL